MHNIYSRDCVLQVQNQDGHGGKQTSFFSR